MSHFTVLVIGENVEKQLAPYQENNMGDCPQEYLEFHDMEEEYQNQYDNDDVEMVEAPTGELLYSWDERFKQKIDGII